MTFRSAAAGLAAIVLLLGFAAPAVSQSNELQEAQQLLKQGQTDRAMERVDHYLKTRPKDARGRFMRGIVLTEQNKPDAAIRAFTELTQDYPELPEPYNNLAVLYASQGQYDKARAALEMAIRTHPSYATAHENLGDIYAKMASQAYDKALQLDRGNRAAQTKLNLIKDLFTDDTRASAVALARTESTPRPATAATRSTTPPAAPVAPVAAPKPAVVAAKEPAKSPAKDTAREPVKAEMPGASADVLLKAVDSWAVAWAGNDVKGYLAHYAPDFSTPRGESRQAWESERTARIAKPRQIAVRVEAPKVVFSDTNRATVTFRQHYQSDTFKSSATKTLVMVKAGNQWLIQEERVGR